MKWLAAPHVHLDNKKSNGDVPYYFLLDDEIHSVSIENNGSKKEEFVVFVQRFVQTSYWIDHKTNIL